MKNRMSGFMDLLFRVMAISLLAAGTAVASAAQDRDIDLHVDGQPISHVLERLNRDYAFNFVLLTPEIDVDRRVSLDLSGVSLADALAEIFEGEDVSYEILGSTVRIRRQDREQSAAVAHTVSGRVLDADGQPLVGAYVLEQGTKNGTVTDLDGNYSIVLTGNSSRPVLTYSFLGYLTSEESVTPGTRADVILEEDSQMLEGVVVMGYGVQKRGNITGAVSTVQARDIEDIPVNNFGAAIAGRTAGVQVVSPSGKPSGGFSVRVRGATSITAGNEPLYVVDGVPTTDTYSINPEEIESITVLKDASSAAIYGSAGANGVVLITTKSGNSEETVVEFNAYYGFSSRPKKMDVLDAAEYESLLADLGYGALDKSVYNANIDWQDEMFQVAPMQNYHLSIAGGTEKTKYYIAGGYTDQDGIIRPSSFKRMNFKVNFEYQAKDWLKIGTTMNYSRITDVDVSDGSSESVVLQSITTPSVVGKYSADGTFMTLPFLSSLENPLSGIDNYDRNKVSNRLLGYFFAEITLWKNLKFKSSLGWEVGWSRYKEFLDPFNSIWGRNQEGMARYNTAFDYKWINENILSWNQDWDRHSLSALAGFIVSKSASEGADVSVQGFSSNKLHILNAGTVFNQPTEYYGASSNVSAISRINYDYDNRLMATVNFRADASSKFGRDSRWGFFPSFSLGWRMSNESFMENALWLNDLKIRAGWGMVGNDQIGNYSSYSIYGTGANYNIDGTILSGYYQSQIGNDKLKWETTSQTNVGVDMSVLRSRINMTLDLYYKHTSDLLLMVNLPLSTGFESGIQNVGKVVNRGIEFQLGTRNLTGKFKWNTDFNISFNDNKVLDMAGSPVIYTGALDKKIAGNVSIIKEGLPLGTFWGYEAAGVNPQDGRMMYENAEGMLVYEEDLDPDVDRREIGCAQPVFTYGINNDFRWKNLSLSILLQGSYGNDIFNATRMFTEGMFDSRNQSSAVLMRWRNPGDYTTIPRPEKDNYPVISSRFVEDGSYLKIRNVRLGYSFPERWISRIRLKSLSVYVSADNLVTWTNYSGLDPEVNIGGTSATAMSIDQGVVPHPRTYVFGVNVVF